MTPKQARARIRQLSKSASSSIEVALDKLGEASEMLAFGNSDLEAARINEQRYRRKALHHKAEADSMRGLLNEYRTEIQCLRERLEMAGISTDTRSNLEPHKETAT